MRRLHNSASDVYGFGIIAYEMLTGRRPMNPDSAYQLLELQRSECALSRETCDPTFPMRLKE
jgi:serine/threonine protein kinase